MKNVYDEVSAFYQGEDAEDYIIPQEWVEGFLRQKAWQGEAAKSLSDIWRNIRYLVAYAAYNDLERVESVSVRDYSVMIEWLHLHERGFTASIRPVRRMFDVLKDFFAYLVGRKLIEETGELAEAAALIAGGKKIRRLKDWEHDIRSVRTRSVEADTLHPGILSAEDFEEAVAAAVERLMGKIGGCFQQKEYVEDLQRALFMFAGPAEPSPEDAQDEFWLGFWDYFLFDYHLLKNDRAPLAHFACLQAETLPPDERQILAELLSARFSVFYISSVLSEDWVECTDLFTEDTFLLPNPEIDYKRVKKLLFYGHVFSRDMVMVNYVTSVEVSLNLRRRIHEEVVRQKTIFAMQLPGVDWQEFFQRHALIVRHTIDMLITYAKVNVTPFEGIGADFPAIEERRAPDMRVNSLLEATMPTHGFSAHDITLAKKMWHDFSQVSEIRVKKPQAWAAAVIYTFSMLNSPHSVEADAIASDMETTANGIFQKRSKLQDALQLRKYDPRYLNEEGFMFSLLAN